MYVNVDAIIFWLRLLSKYLIEKWDTTRIRADLCIFYNKDDKKKLDLVISARVDYLFTAVKLVILKKLKDVIKSKLNIQEYGKVKKFLEFYYEWGHYEKVP